MAEVVLVHGIFNLKRGMAPEGAAAQLETDLLPHLERGFRDAHLAHIPLPAIAMSYYAHLLTNAWTESQAGATQDKFEDLPKNQVDEAWEWLQIAGVPVPEEVQAGWVAPLRQGLGWLVRERDSDSRRSRTRQETMLLLERVIVACLREVDAYTSRPERRARVRAAVAETIRKHRPRVLIAHSLGSLVAYETLHAHPDLEVELLVTVGSPLGLPAIMRKLEPEPRGRGGARPAGVGTWVNLADAGDFVAMPPKLGQAFPVDLHQEWDTGNWHFHSFKGYLQHGLLAAAITPYLSPGEKPIA
ncbi:hypothetical protein ACWET9_43865 [Streptomyces sp. NPDC004059]